MSEKVKLIVTLSKGQYENLKDIQFGGISSRMIFNAVKNGTPLPEGHGRLIDADKLPYEDIECTNGRTYMVVNAYDVDNAPTIIEADKAESEDKE